MSERLQEIKQRNAARAKGRWKWAHDYEIRDDWNGVTNRHWCLHSPDYPDGGKGDGYKRCINPMMVLNRTSSYYTVDGSTTGPDALTEEEKARGLQFVYRSVDKHPDFEFIANAPADITWLIEEVERLRALSADCIKYLKSAGLDGLAVALTKELNGDEQAAALRKELEG